MKKPGEKAVSELKGTNAVFWHPALGGFWTLPNGNLKAISVTEWHGSDNKKWATHPEQTKEFNGDEVVYIYGEL